MDDLSGKTALVTGSSTGIGAAVAEAFGARGMKVAVHYHASKTAAEDVAHKVEKAGGKAAVLSGDVRKAAVAAGLISQTVKTFGRLDILVNNAGDIVKRAPIRDATDNLYDAIMDLNARSVFVCCREAIPVFEKQGSGNIISTSSLTARNGGGGGSVLYAGAKGFVSSFTRGLAKELAPMNVRVNAVSPGVIMTPMQDKHTSAEGLAAAIAITPMKRTATPEECVGAYLYLASDNASGFVTGQVIEVNGGIYMP
jgi:3-oxoacyl-[acyl-carrier protein] reductase